MRNDFESNYLAHHGILGQKWGKKNGPPYPLGAEDHSAREKKAGYRKSLGGKKNEHLYDRNNKSSKSSSGSETKESKEKFHLSDKQKKYIKIGLAVAGTALVAYGGYKLYQSGALQGLVSKGKSATSQSNILGDKIENAISSSKINIAKSHTGASNGIIPLSKDSKMYNALEGANKSRRMDNCKELSLESACRALGVDVDLNSANPQVDKNLSQICEELGIGSKIRGMTPQSTNPDEVKQQVKRYLLNRNKEGDVGVISVGYSEEAQKRMAKELADTLTKHGLPVPENFKIEGHAFNYVIENGDVTFADGQPGIPVDKSGIFADVDFSKQIEILPITQEIAETIKKNS